MNFEEFLNEYEAHIASHKEFPDGTIRMKFEDVGEVMWLKGILAEEVGMKMCTSTPGGHYWFDREQ